MNLFVFAELAVKGLPIRHNPIEKVNFCQPQNPSCTSSISSQIKAFEKYHFDSNCTRLTCCIPFEWSGAFQPPPGIVTGASRQRSWSDLKGCFTGIAIMARSERGLSRDNQC